MRRPLLPELEMSHVSIAYTICIHPSCSTAWKGLGLGWGLPAGRARARETPDASATGKARFNLKFLVNLNEPT